MSLILGFLLVNNGKNVFFSTCLASVLITHFWLKKQKPFFYLLMKKNMVLLLVENPRSWIRLAQRVGSKRYFSTPSSYPPNKKKFSPLPPIEPNTIKLMSISFMCWLVSVILIQTKKVWLFGYFLWAGIFFNIIYYCFFVNRLRWLNYIEYLTTLDLNICSKWKCLYTYFMLLLFTLRLAVIHIFFNTWGGRLLQQLMALFVLATITFVPPAQHEWSMLVLISLEFSIWGTLFVMYYTIFSKKKLILSYIPEEVIGSLIIIPSVRKQDDK